MESIFKVTIPGTPKSSHGNLRKAIQKAERNIPQIISITKDQLIQKILKSQQPSPLNRATIVPRLSHEQQQEIDLLEITDYIKLLAHQKKSIPPRKWARLTNLNESLKLQQEDYKYYLLVLTQGSFLKLDNPNYYQTILKQSPNYPNLYFGAIEKDIPRTLPQNNPFSVPLKNILIAYAIRNPSLLYCQGMNYLAAYLLINSFSEEEAFWFLTCLIEQVLPRDFYKDLGTVSIASLAFNDLLKIIFPEFAEQMEEIGMDTSMFLVSWFVCLFTKGFINSVSHYLLAEIVILSRKFEIGYVLVVLGLGIIACVQSRENGKFVSFEKDDRESQWSSSERYDPRTFKENFETSVFEISLKQLRQGIAMISLDYHYFMTLYNFYKEKRQERMKIAIDKEIKENLENLLKANCEENQNYAAKHSRFTLPECKQEYPVCLQRTEIEKKVGEVEQVYILTNGRQIEQTYIENYFSVQNDPKNQREFNSEVLNSHQQNSVYNGQGIIKDFADCLFYRRPHICTGVNRTDRVKRAVLKKGISLKEEKQPYNSKESRLVSRNCEDRDFKGKQKREISKEVDQLDQHEHEYQCQKSNFMEIDEDNRQYEVSLERNSRFSAVEDRFQELSTFFVIDPEYLSKQNIGLQDEEEFPNQNKQKETQNVPQNQNPLDKSSKLAAVGTALKKVLNSLKILKGVKDKE